MVTLTILLIALVIVGTLQIYLTIRGFGPPAGLAEFAPTHRDQRVMLAPPQAVLQAYQASTASTPGMRVVGGGEGFLLLDTRPAALVLDGDYGSTIRVSVAPVGGQVSQGGQGNEGAGPASDQAPRSLVTVESMPKTAWVGRVLSADAGFVAKERALRMAAKQIGGFNEEL